MVRNTGAERGDPEQQMVRNTEAERGDPEHQMVRNTAVERGDPETANGQKHRGGERSCRRANGHISTSK